MIVIGGVIDVIDALDVINVLDVIEKALKCTCLYIILNTLSVYNMLMQLPTYNTNGKALIAIANRNQHYEVS